MTHPVTEADVRRIQTMPYDRFFHLAQCAVMGSSSSRGRFSDHCLEDGLREELPEADIILIMEAILDRLRKGA